MAATLAHIEEEQIPIVSALRPRKLDGVFEYKIPPYLRPLSSETARSEAYYVNENRLAKLDETFKNKFSELFYDENYDVLSEFHSQECAAISGNLKIKFGNERWGFLHAMINHKYEFPLGVSFVEIAEKVLSAIQNSTPTPELGNKFSIVADIELCDKSGVEPKTYKIPVKIIVAYARVEKVLVQKVIFGKNVTLWDERLVRAELVTFFPEKKFQW